MYLPIRLIKTLESKFRVKIYSSHLKLKFSTKCQCSVKSVLIIGSHAVFIAAIPLYYCSPPPFPPGMLLLLSSNSVIFSSIKGITNDTFLERLNSCCVSHFVPYHKFVTVRSFSNKINDNVCEHLLSHFKNYHFCRHRNSVVSVICYQFFASAFAKSQFVPVIFEPPCIWQACLFTSKFCNFSSCLLHSLIWRWTKCVSAAFLLCCFACFVTFNLKARIYKVVQIRPGRFVCKQVTVCPGHIWTTLYEILASCLPLVWIDLFSMDSLSLPATNQLV
jgi:hypothetical protein